MTPSSNRHLYLYLFVIFLFFGIISVNLFSDGMFMDGLFYAAISRNMAEGLGSFWQPYLSETLFPKFYEHPPLALGLESLTFRLLGNTIYAERLYSLLTYVATGYIMVLIWKELTDDTKGGWLAIFMWLIIGNVTWGAENNMLENTMTVFVVLSVLFYLKSNKRNTILWIFLSGTALFAGLLSKGFVCLYIWSLPFFLWLLMRNTTFKRMLSDSFLFVISTLLPLAVLYFFVSPAHDHMTMYFNKQVIGSIENVQTVNNRYTIVGLFFEGIIFPLLIAVVLILWTIKKKDRSTLMNKRIRLAAAFFLVVLSGVFPIMISMKQRSFYILTVYPIFALGIAYLLYPIVKIMLEDIPEKIFKAFKIITIIVVVTSLLLAFSQTFRTGRNETMISDTKLIINKTGERITVNICPDLYSDWSLHGYFVRYGYISLDNDQKNFHKYYVATEDCNKGYLEKLYTPVSVNTIKYKLYRRKLSGFNIRPDIKLLKSSIKLYAETPQP